MMDGRGLPRGRYACGCAAEFVNGTGGVTRLVPLCSGHGDGLALSTALMRKISAVWRRGSRGRADLPWGA